MKPTIPECNAALAALYGRIEKHVRLAFFCALAAGFLTHLYMFTNKLPNHDDIICLFFNDATVTSGRWSLPVLSAFSSNFSLPWVNGVIGVFALACLAAGVVKLLGIKKPVEIALVAWILVSFPSVGNAFGFMFTADAYLLAFMIATIAALLADGPGLRWLAAVPLLVFSAATYQATICFFVALLAVRALQLLLSGAVTDREILNKLLRYVAAAVAAALLYVLSAKAALAITGQQMENYTGLDEMGKLSLSAVPGMFYNAYREFFEFALVTSGRHAGVLMSVAHLIIGLAIAALAAILIFRGACKTRLQRILAALTALLLPVLLNSARLLGAPRVHAIMMYGVVMAYVLLIVLTDLYGAQGSENGAGGEAGGKAGADENEGGPAPAAKSPARMLGPALASWVAVIAVAFSAACWGVYTNQCYLKLQLKYENTYALVNRVVDRVEQDEHYGAGMPVAFIGEANAGSYAHSKDGNLGSLGADEGFGGPDEFGFVYDDRHFKDFAKWYLGVKFETADAQLLKKLAADPRVLAMPFYPYDGSVQPVDGVLVVRLGG